jgi:S-sulfo-L-cysteine synthase (O-acetyl-L-serine-dependent)
MPEVTVPEVAVPEEAVSRSAEAETATGLAPVALRPTRATARRSAAGLLAAVCATPLVEVDLGPEAPAGARLFAKLEGGNPGGSIKDRPVARMLTRALAAGRLAAGRRLLDSSSGNAGIAYAQLGAALGVGVTLVVPGNASRERRERIAACGAELILTDPVEGYDHAVATARELARRHPERYWYCDQYSNPDNWRAHFATTGAELLRQVRSAAGRRPDAFLAGVGTGGTLTGVGRRLRRADRGVTLCGVLPERFPGIEGLKTLGPGDFVPAILDRSLVCRWLEVSSEEAVAGCRGLAAQGLFVGPSSGACFTAARRLAREGRHQILATVFADSGERYASTGMWEP